jgi:hypothetical protein
MEEGVVPVAEGVVPVAEAAMLQIMQDLTLEHLFWIPKRRMH